MTQTIVFGISLGERLSGLTLNGQIIDTDGDDVGGAITTGFIEIGDGMYMLTCDTIPDSHAGGIKIFENGETDILGFAPINPSILDEVSEGSITVRQVFRFIMSWIAGKASGGGTGTITFRDLADTSDRIILNSVDADGDRGAVSTLDGS